MIHSEREKPPSNPEGKALVEKCRSAEEAYIRNPSGMNLNSHLLFLKNIMSCNDHKVTWEQVVALANREMPGINKMKDLEAFLEPLKFRERELSPVVPYYPKMCGALKANGHPCRNDSWRCSCSNKRCLIQLARINGNTCTAWLIPYYYELPNDGDVAVDSVLQQAYACLYGGQYVKLTEKDRIYVKKNVVNVWIADADVKLPVLNFAFRTPYLNPIQYYFTDRDLELPLNARGLLQ